MANDPLVTCKITGEKIRKSEAIPVAILRDGLVKFIRKFYPELSQTDYISIPEIKKLRRKYIENVLKAEKGELSKLDKDVIKSMVEHESLVKKLDANAEEKNLTLGQKMSDHLSRFGGSWTFLILFALVLVAWIITNIVFLASKPFDPYPFILLNLCLSCLAAIQAPIIMMSQNRKDAKDRVRAENDYKVNLKAELEVRHLHEKMDNLMRHQWQRLLEIQQLQLDMLEERDEHHVKRKSNKKESEKDGTQNTIEQNK